MARTRSLTRTLNHDDDHDHDHDDASSSNTTRPKTCAPWSDLNHDVVNIVMMKLGVVDFLSFSGVCKLWRSVALLKRDTFMASSPPMSISISSDANEEECCYLEDFEGRKFKSILPHFAVAASCLGITCGYLIFFTKETREFWLVNPITRKELHFPDFPFNPRLEKYKVILVFSPSISGLVLVLYRGEIRFSVAGKGAWNHVSYTRWVTDLYAFRGKIYTLSSISRYPFHRLCHLCELRLYPEPKFTLLETKNPLYSEIIHPTVFASSSEKLYVVCLNNLLELDFDQRKWVVMGENAMREYAIFASNLNHAVVAVKWESWANPQSRGKYADTSVDGKISLFTADMWYLPHQYVDVDRIDELNTTLV